MSYVLRNLVISNTAVFWLVFSCPFAKADTFKITSLASFTGALYAPPNSYAGVIRGVDGNLYGTTSQGGTGGGFGTVFSFSTNGGLLPLASFNGANGSTPYSGLIQGLDGGLYGTTTGGTNSLGTVFRITTNGSLATLVSFSGSNGAAPYAALLQTSNGLLYGTTTSGGISNRGTIFKMTTNGALTTLVSFTNANGATPVSALTLGADGALYGTTFRGGAAGGWGTVFRMTTNGALTTLHSFDGTNGALPYAGVTQDAFGVLYGTASFGGIGFDGSVESGWGTLFQLTTNGSFNNLYSFSEGGADGHTPSWGRLVFGKDHLLYGSTYQGGTFGWGTFFQITTNGIFNSLFSFDYDAAGYAPYGELLPDTYDSFYGTTSGASSSGGTLFRLNPAQPTLTPLSHQNSAFLATCNTLIGQSYQLQFKTNLNQTSWINAVAPYLATNASTTISNFTGSDPSRLYRMVLLLSP